VPVFVLCNSYDTKTNCEIDLRACPPERILQPFPLLQEVEDVEGPQTVSLPAPKAVKYLF